MSRQPVKVAWLKWVVSESDEALKKDGRLKYPKLVNEASRTLKQSTQNSKTMHYTRKNATDLHVTACCTFRPDTGMIS